MENDEKHVLLLENGTDHFQGIPCFLGATLVILLGSKMHCLRASEGASGPGR